MIKVFKFLEMERSNLENSGVVEGVGSARVCGCVGERDYL